MTAPLEGIVVADFSRVLAGPYATMLLADLGATVIKVERPGVGDDTRAWGPPWAAESSSYFESVNRSKLSVVLDLTDPADLEVARSLAAKADVVIENFRAGTMGRYGLDHECVAAGNPGVVYCSITGFGSGAGAALPGYDFVVQALGGLMSITGEPDRDPMKVGVALVDVLTGKDATIAILAALRSRDVHGLGQRVEVNLLSSLLGSLANQASSYLATGRPPERMGNQHPSIAPYETLDCADGVIALACGNDAQFVRLVDVLGKPELATDPRFGSNAERVANRVELVRALEERLVTSTAEKWEQALLEAGIAAARVGDLGSAFTRATELGLDPTFAVGPGRTAQVSHPITYSDHAPRRDLPPPGLGEHGRLVRDWCATPAGNPLVFPVRTHGSARQPAS
ncbi:carnitine dehydratase [Humibacillus sp. DSM 29435]|uniref:CaiB/BaiF CoA transferase family protein n=1 Tax=Humibacillus sp. DSM 29435 TaxID=1869167 RepID=UPI0008728377|nr:CoA transferase [Humibacillus sp. DSM 29435]OFE15393.1 carnitine dehydratase [Humibacillus sp. DSM 29435]